MEVGSCVVLQPVHDPMITSPTYYVDNYSKTIMSLNATSKLKSTNAPFFAADKIDITEKLTHKFIHKIYSKAQIVTMEWKFQIMTTK
jgi:hypothetical protein